MIFVILVNVDMCEIVVIISEITDHQFSTAIFIFLFLLKFWCEVITIVWGCMRMSGDV